MKQQIHDTILPEKLGIQVCPFSVKLRLAQEQLLVLNKWIDKQFPNLPGVCGEERAEELQVEGEVRVRY